MPITLSAAMTILLVACGPRFVPQAQQGTFSTIIPSASATAVSSGGPSVAPSSSTSTFTIPGGTNQVPRGGVIKVGGLFPLSGGLSSLGKPAYQGAQAYFNWINDNGGIAGYKFQFIPCDDQGDDTQSTACAKKLVTQDKVFIMGPSFTPFSLTVVRYLQGVPIPWIGYDGINVEGFSAPNVVTIGAPIDSFAHVLMPHWFKTITAETGSAPKKLGVVVLDSAPAQTYVNEAKRYICPKLGCTIVREQPINYSTTVFTPICQNFQNDKVDSVWIVTDPASAIKLMVQCQSIGYKPPKGYLGQHGIYLDLTLQQTGKYADKIFANGAVLPDSVNAPATNELKKIVRTYYPDASFGYFVELAYASARMVADLVKNVVAANKPLDQASMLAAASAEKSYQCNGLCKNVNLTPPASVSGGNHYIWLVRSDFSSGSGRWLEAAGPFDAFRSDTWPCAKGKPKPC